MGTKGVGVYGINSVFSSGNLIFYEKAVGRTDTGDVFTIGTTAVTVGGTAQAVDFSWYATGSASVVISASGTSLTLVGVNMATNAALTISLTTDASSLTAGALIVAGGIACAKKLFVGDDIDMSVNGTGVYDITLKDAQADALSIVRGTTDMMVFDSSTPKITITPATTIAGILTSNGGITMGDAKDIITNGTTGTKIGTATTQKIGLWNATPIIQPIAVADVGDGLLATTITQLNALLARVRSTGLIAT